MRSRSRMPILKMTIKKHPFKTRSWLGVVFLWFGRAPYAISLANADLEDDDQKAPI